MVDRKIFQFFLVHGGYCTPPGKTACALRAAHNEARAREVGIEFRWEPDDWLDFGDNRDEKAKREQRCQDCNELPWNFAALLDGNARQPKYSCEHYSESCCAVLDGEVLASLGGITDADRNYRRVIESDLASEALDIHDRLEREQEATDAVWIGATL